MTCLKRIPRSVVSFLSASLPGLALAGALALPLPLARAADEAPPAPASVPCPACRGTAVCQANACKDGKMLCPATCLKKETPGWTDKKIEGFPDHYIWMPYRWKDGKGTQYISQAHIGELIEYDEGGKPVSRGRCPTCEGTSRVACKTCEGDAKCRVCSGAGKFIRDQQLFTLTDQQGRALEAVILRREGDKLIVLRLADQKTFQLPLAKLSAESTERIEQRFPIAP